MSHVVVVDVQIKNLEALKKACETLGLEFIEGQTKFKWYGRHVGDYPLPNGFNKEDMGKCAHALRVKGNNRAYEIGVCERRDGQEGFCLLWDFWGGGYGLQNVVGNECDNLINEYSKEAARAEVNEMAIEDGWMVDESYNGETGETTITLRRY